MEEICQHTTERFQHNQIQRKKKYIGYKIKKSIPSKCVKIHNLGLL